MSLYEQIKAIPTGTKVRAVFEGELNRWGNGTSFLNNNGIFLFNSVQGVEGSLVSVEVMEPTDDEIVASLKEHEWITFTFKGFGSYGPVSTFYTGVNLCAGEWVVRSRDGVAASVTNVRRVAAPEVK